MPKHNKTAVINKIEIAIETGKAQLFEQAVIDTPIHEIRSYLLETRSGSPKSQLERAIRAGRTDIVNHMLALNFVDKNRLCDYLHYAIEYNQSGIFDLFLKNNNNNNNLNNTFRGLSPLHLAAKLGRLNFVDKLIDCPGVDINLSNNENESPLSLAVENKHDDIVRLLVEKGASINDAVLTKACYYNPGIAMYLINNMKEKCNQETFMSFVWELKLDEVEALANKFSELTSNLSDKNALHLIARSSSFTGIQDKQKVIAMAEYLIEKRQISVEEKDKDNHTPLQTAIYHDEAVLINYLIGKGAKIDTFDLYETLYVAVCQDDIKKVKEIVTKDPKICWSKLTKQNGQFEAKLGSPLYAAVVLGRDDILKELLECSSKAPDVEKADNVLFANMNILSSQTLLSGTVIYGNLSTLKILKNAGANSKQLALYNQTPLNLAISAKDTNKIKYLIEEMIADVNLGESRPIMQAVSDDNYDLVEYLVSKGANLNSSSNMNNQDDPLHVAVRKGDMKMIELLVTKGAKINPVSGSEPPLHIAIKLGNKTVIEWLLAKGADLSGRNLSGETPLHVALKTQSEDIIQSIVEKQTDETINLSDDQGNTPLHLSPSHHAVLLSKGADSNIFNEKGYTPLYQTLMYEVNKDGQCQLADSLKGDVNASNKNGDSLLHIAVNEERLDIVNYLVSKGANVHAPNLQSQSPFLLALMSGQLEVIKHMVENSNININKAIKYDSNDDKYPLWIAIHHGQLDVVKYLIGEKNADMELLGKDNLGITALHMAARYGQKDIVSYLLGLPSQLQKINAAPQEIRQYTPLHYAVLSGNLDVVKQLVRAGANIEAKALASYGPGQFTAFDLSKLNEKHDVSAFLILWKLYQEQLNKSASIVEKIITILKADMSQSSNRSYNKENNHELDSFIKVIESTERPNANANALLQTLQNQKKCIGEAKFNFITENILNDEILKKNLDANIVNPKKEEPKKEEPKKEEPKKEEPKKEEPRKEEPRKEDEKIIANNIGQRSKFFNGATQMQDPAEARKDSWNEHIKKDHATDKEGIELRLEHYISRIEKHLDAQSNIDFAWGFWKRNPFRDSQATNRHANYDLARDLLTAMKGMKEEESDKLRELFERDKVTSMRNAYEHTKDRIWSRELSSILDDARKLYPVTKTSKKRK